MRATNIQTAAAIFHGIPSDDHVRNNASGRLDARIIADLFGYTRAALAKLIQVSRQVLTATPDAECIQSSLHPFARIATLAPLVGDGDFRKWLNTGCRDFNGQTPRQIIDTGNVKGVADYVEDIIQMRAPHD